MTPTRPGRIRLTKSLVKTITPPDPGTSDHSRGYSITWDDDLRGFGLLTTIKGVKSYIVRARIKSKERRHTIGRANVLSADKARELAQSWLGEIAAGHDPVADQAKQKVEGVTLSDALARYAGNPKLAPRTKDLVMRSVQASLTDWLNLPLVKIDAGMVERRHQAITEDHPGLATVVFRYFRAIWNVARIASKDATGDYFLPPCPTSILSEKRLWNRHVRRQRAIAPHQFPAWFNAVEALPDPKARAFFVFCLMTGCRRDEAARLTWQDTDLTGKSVTFRNTKAGKHHADPDHHLPLPRQLVELLADLKREAVGVHVFGDALGRYRGQSAFSFEIQKITENYGPFGPHDLRRSFVSVAETLGIPSLTTKKLVNHSVNQDMTGGYYVAVVETLRVPMQRIADQIEAYRLAVDNVVTLRAKA